MSDEHLWMKRTLAGLEPESEYDRQLLGKWKIGARVRVDLKQPRSGKRQRLYWALMRLVWENQEFYASPEALHTAIKLRLGHVNEIVLHNGEVHVQPSSTSYDSMDEGTFGEYLDRTIALIVTEIIPDIDRHGRKELTRRAHEMLGLPPG